MTDRGLKIALAVSVALNVFVVGSVVGGVIVGGRFLAERGRDNRPPALELVRTLPEPAQEAAATTLREAGLQARPQFETARRERAQAVELAAAESFDRQAVAEALARSRESELAGRSRLEGAMLDVLQPLSREERRALAGALARRGPEGRGRGRGRFGGGRRFGPDGVSPPSDPAAVAAPAETVAPPVDPDPAAAPPD